MAFLQMMEKQNNTGSSLGFIAGYLNDRGARGSLKSIWQHIKISNLLDDYSIVKGISGGYYASRGPFFVQIDLTDQCNNNCVCCWCNSALKKEKIEERKKESLDHKRIKEIIDELKQYGAKEITLSGGGEPFMHPCLFEIIDYIKSKNIFCQLYTNLTLASEKSIKAMVNLELDRLVVSLWAADAKTYCLLHPNKDENHFYKIRDNLILISEEKKKNRKKKPLIHIHNVINALNYNEIKHMEDLACSVNADEVSFAVTDAIPSITDSLLLSEEQRKAALKEFEELNHSINICDRQEFKRRLSAKGATYGEYDRDVVNVLPCYLGWMFVRIKANGDVNPCLKAHRLSVGNIYQQDFKEIWNSPLQREFRAKTRMPKKDSSYFCLIGNGSHEDIGCFRVCDDLTRNIVMHRKLTLLPTTRIMFKIAKLEKRFSRLGRLLRIFYLFVIVIIYSLILKIYRTIKRMVIFPGE